MATPALKLTYFDLNGRAANIRKTLTLGGVPFVDERLSQDEFKQRKPTLPYGKLPVLEVDGEVVAETQAILRYVGRLAGMYPPIGEEPLAAAMIDEMLNMFDDMFERHLMPSLLEQDVEKKKLMREELLKGPLPHAFELIDKRLAQILAYEYFKRDPAQLSLLDTVAWDWVVFMRSGMLDHIPKTFVDDYKTMVALHDKVEATPRTNKPKTSQAQPSPTTTLSPKKLKLTYFDVPGCAEPIRMALRLGGIAFEDERITNDTFKQLKPTLPNEQVPVLHVDGEVMFAQSVAILRYVGGFTGLYPTQDALEGLRIDEVLSHVGELFFAIAHSVWESDPEKRQKLLESLATTTIPESLGGLDRRLAHWKKERGKKSLYAMGGESPTIADLAICNFVGFLQSGALDRVPTSIVDEHAEIIQASDAVKKHPRLQQWYAPAASETAA